MIPLKPGYINKSLKVLCNNGKSFVGRCEDFTYANDNEPEIDSITLWVETAGHIEIFDNEIESLEIIK